MKDNTDDMEWNMEVVAILAGLLTRAYHGKDDHGKTFSYPFEEWICDTWVYLSP